MREISRLVGLLAASVVLGSTGSAGAATLKAEYQLQGNRASAVAGASDLTDLGPGNQFVTEAVGGVTRQVLAFPKGGGMSLATAGLVDPQDFSVVMVFRLDEVSGYRRLLDLSAGGADRGLYVLNGRVVLYGLSSLYLPVPSVVPGTYLQVALIRGSDFDGTQWTEVDVNGEPAIFAEGADDFTLDSGLLRFFQDNVSGPFTGEESAGALSCALVYAGVLTPEEVVQHAVDPTRCQPTVSPPAPAPRPAPDPRPVPAPTPAPAPAPAPSPPFRTGTYVGRTSQGLPISFTVGTASAQSVYFRWRATCADGRVRTKGMLLGSARIRVRDFTVGGVLGNGGRGRVSGRLRSDGASGTFSRWGRTASGVVCRVRDVRWRAHLVHG